MNNITDIKTFRHISCLMLIEGASPLSQVKPNLTVHLVVLNIKNRVGVSVSAFPTSFFSTQRYTLTVINCHKLDIQVSISKDIKWLPVAVVWQPLHHPRNQTFLCVSTVLCTLCTVQRTLNICKMSAATYFADLLTI